MRSCVICGSFGLAVEGIVTPPECGSRAAQIVVDEPGSTMVRLVCEDCGTAMLFKATPEILAQSRAGSGR